MIAKKLYILIIYRYNYRYKQNSEKKEIIKKKNNFIVLLINLII